MRSCESDILVETLEKIEGIVIRAVVTPVYAFMTNSSTLQCSDA